MIENEDTYSNSIFKKSLEIPIHTRKNKFGRINLFRKGRVFTKTPDTLKSVDFTPNLTTKKSKHLTRSFKINSMILDHKKNKDKFYHANNKLSNKLILIPEANIKQYSYDENDPFLLRKNININKNENNKLPEGNDYFCLSKLWKNVNIKDEVHLKFPKIKVNSTKNRVESKRIVCHGM